MCESPKTNVYGKKNCPSISKERIEQRKEEVKFGNILRGREKDRNKSKRR